MCLKVIAILILCTVSNSFSQTVNYFIIPDEATHPCNINNCITIEELGLVSLDHENISLTFVGGSYLLSQTHSFVNKNHIELVSNNTATIKCQSESGFNFSNIKNLLIENIELNNCFTNQSHGGAISMTDVERIDIRNCSFQNNSIVGNEVKGGALYIKESDSVIITGCVFIGNSAANLCTSCMGGTLFVTNSITIAINHCEFKQSTASLDAGAIAVQQSTVTITTTNFSNNFAIGDGGAVIFQNTSATILDTTFLLNRASTGFGGAISIQGASTQTSNNIFVMNQAGASGGAIFVNNGTVNESDNQYTGNQAFKGGCVAGQKSNIISLRSQFFSNNAAFGAVVYVSACTLTVTECQVTLNIAFFCSQTPPQCFLGVGALYAENTQVFLTESNFTQNRAAKGGAVLAEESTIHVIQSYFIQNIGLGGVMAISKVDLCVEHSVFINNGLAPGGVVFATNSTITTNNSSYMNNNGGTFGGVIFTSNSSVSSINSEYINNQASLGGVIFSSLSSITSRNSTFAGNTANTAGAIMATSSEVVITDSIFERNKAVSQLLSENTNNSLVMLNAIVAGAISLYQSTLSSTNTLYDSNEALHLAGAINTQQCTTSIYGDTYINNKAQEGATVYSTSGKILITGSNFTSNQASLNGVIIARSTTLTIKDQLIFQSNQGSLSSFDSQVEFLGDTLLANNNGIIGGAITSTQSTLIFSETSTVRVVQNRAEFGGGISLTESILQMSSPDIEITGNEASMHGGAVYSIQSQIEFRPTLPNATIQIANNIAHKDGGGFHAVATHIELFKGIVTVEKNRAGQHGGALYLESNSKLYLLKEIQETTLTSKKSPSLEITNNKAQRGGAIYIADETNRGTLCRASSSIFESTATDECFLQVIQLYQNFPFANNPLTFGLMANPNTQQNLTSITTYNNVKLKNNTANLSAAAIYGGLLDRCTLNLRTELANVLPNSSSTYSGFDYLKLLIEFDGVSDFQRWIAEDADNYPLNIIQTISKRNVTNLITSGAVQVCFCQNNMETCDNTSPTITVRKGETFTVNLVAVDHVGNPTKADIISRANSKSGLHRLREGQNSQKTEDQCTEIEYNIFAADSTAEIQLYAAGPCDDLGISLTTLDIQFLPCTCPNGFQPSPSDIECICVCNDQLSLSEVECCIENQTITIASNIWVGPSNTSSKEGFIVHKCPFDYCDPEPVTISFNNESTVDNQCAFHRAGKLCGNCKQGLSLVLGTSRCKECTSYYIFMLVPFAAAGIAVIALIIGLNLTVATGTINGLVFYANILAANHSIFLPSNNNILSVFISWINLDLGIETCFYQGMDAYGKVLLQFVFPVYLFSLIAIIIITSELSQRVSNLLGKRNPVAALSTLFLLSYSKLLRTTIECLQFTTLILPDNSTEVVWLLDASVSYSKLEHIPRFVFAITIIILGSVYTLLLLFGQCFHLCSKKKMMKWVRKPKYNAIIEAYHAPFTPKHRYWVGLLLLIRIVHYLISAFASPSATILSVGCIVFFLLILKTLATKVYKLWELDVLEISFLMNLGVLTLCTYYVQLTNEVQQVATYTSVSIALVTFIAILCYHFYKYFMKNTKLWQNNILNSKLATVLSKYSENWTSSAGPQRWRSTENEEGSECQYRDTALELSDPTVYSNQSASSAPEELSRAPEVTFTIIDRNGHKE